DLDIIGFFVIGILEDNTRLSSWEGEETMESMLIFHLQEGEESLYWTEEKQYQKINGYFIFYERNPQMQKYMTEHGAKECVEKEEPGKDKAIVSFRNKVKEKMSGKRTGTVRYLASSFLLLTVLMLGVTIIHNYDKMKDIEAVIQQLSAEKETEYPTASQVLSNAASLKEENSLTETGILPEEKGGSLSENNQTGTEAQMENAQAELEDPSDSIPTAANTSAGQNQSAANALTGEDQSAAGALAGLDQSVANALAGEDQSAAGTSAEQTQLSSDALTNQNADSSEALSNQTQDETQADGTRAASSSLITNDFMAERNYSAEKAQDAEANIQSLGKTDEITASATRQQQAAYTIKYGDTLADISQKYYGSLEMVQEICQVNGIDDANLIIPGQKIVLP
ncbi:MAG: LysM peptidoglycan-binding domain-containing protein, partial [Lachnospiraceae bacterium]|nr:LysM peptidoglycan-binding domain-containing protein [Lachnospiraceae bacterium]